ncbi:Aste57867_16064 [Aphanomyces stellatus]|uniref:Aste57867_16064 protein n=1 Tax=Aphanomyces stellatus TaxID=120398 RepID=A0A485L4W3_9STRA|nr:hypothetical protein As57867_016008 [Aphanomyces stellatus]VFT92848.1 Aste57867_16064 [Aphanomyces stellatus]
MATTPTDLSSVLFHEQSPYSFLESPIAASAPLRPLDDDDDFETTFFDDHSGGMTDEEIAMLCNMIDPRALPLPPSRDNVWKKPPPDPTMMSPTSTTDASSLCSASLVEDESNDSNASLLDETDSVDAKKQCAAAGCHKRVRSRGLCKAHGGGRRCSVSGCLKSSQGQGLCIRHGGGRRCMVDGCSRGAQSNGRCKNHGGGIRCGRVGCSKSSQGGGFCRSHGGGKICKDAGCLKGSQRKGWCATHYHEFEGAPPSKATHESMHCLRTLDSTFELRQIAKPRVSPVSGQSNIPPVNSFEMEDAATVTTGRAAPHGHALLRRHISLTDHLVTLALRAIALFVGILPPMCFVPLGRVIGRLGYAAGVRKRCVKENIARAFPALSKAHRRRIALETYENTCVSLLWFLHLRAFGRWKHMESYVDILFPTEYLSDLRRGPVLVTSAHIGCWELLPCIHAPPYLHVDNVYELYRPLHNAPLDAFVRLLRQHNHPHIHLLPDKECLPALTSILGSSMPDIVGLVCDQRPSRHAVPVRFLGQTAQIAPGAALLHLRTHRPIWFTALLLQDQGKPFCLYTLPVARGGAAVQDTSVAEIMQQYATLWSGLVRAHPSQYLWFHNLWKDTPI